MKGHFMRVRIGKRGVAVGASAVLLLAMAGCATATETASTDGEATESTESAEETTEELLVMASYSPSP